MLWHMKARGCFRRLAFCAWKSCRSLQATKRLGYFQPGTNPNPNCCIVLYYTIPYDASITALTVAMLWHMKELGCFRLPAFCAWKSYRSLQATKRLGYFQPGTNPNPNPCQRPSVDCCARKDLACCSWMSLFLERLYYVAVFDKTLWR